ncbi:MAG: flavodoxin family protein [Candidatus Thorarchaeota archaeon]|nr:MAG: flavodoxin family protein [Candidatus Thorarchaeota archaeon]
MSRVLILNGSARAKGNTRFLINQLNRVLEEKGLESSILQLHELNVKHCRGCFWCYKGFPLRCVQDDDDMNGIYPTIIEADVIVFASPIYWFNYSGQLKLFIDRLVALHVKGGHKLDGKRFAAIFVYGDTNVEESGVQHAIASIKHLIRYMKGETIGIVHGTANDIGDAEKNTTLVAEVRELANRICDAS